MSDAPNTEGFVKRFPKPVIDACIDHGVRPPVAGWHYAAFAVHPRQPGPVVLAIGHRCGEKIVIDLVRDGLTVPQACDLLKAYGINTVTGADDEGDGSVSLAHAVAGVVHVLRDRACLN
jgi:hypothetical protein